MAVAPNAGRGGVIMTNGIDFKAISQAALPLIIPMLRRWLPDGSLNGSEYVARNPTRSDRNAGSFKNNISTGQWADFATGDQGGDLVSLGAYLDGCTQSEAA